MPDFPWGENRDEAPDYDDETEDEEDDEEID